MSANDDTKILIITTMISSYPGANTVGQARLQYPAGTYILRVPDPVMFPEAFYLRAFERGIDGIIIMSSGSDCPYEGAYPRLSARVARVYEQMKERGISVSRLKLTTIWPFDAAEDELCRRQVGHPSADLLLRGATVQDHFSHVAPPSELINRKITTPVREPELLTREGVF